MTRKTQPTTDSADVAKVHKPQPLISDSNLQEIASFDDAVRLIEQQLGGTIERADEVIGSGFHILKNKGQLVDVDFLAVTWAFHDSDDYTHVNDDGEVTAGQFVSVHVITRTGEKFIINDGTKGGVRDQLRDYSERSGRTTGLFCPGGLTVSEYDHTDPNTGAISKAHSYYLAAG